MVKESHWFMVTICHQGFHLAIILLFSYTINVCNLNIIPWYNVIYIPLKKYMYILTFGFNLLFIKISPTASLCHGLK